jgi:hypothetical protein
MSITAGFLISFAIVVFGSVGLAIFAITHRQRGGEVGKKDSHD